MEDYNQFSKEMLIAKIQELEQQIADQKVHSQTLSFYQNIFSQSSMGMSAYDSTGQCIAANWSIAKMVGADSIDQILAQNYHHIESWRKSLIYQDVLDVVNNKQSRSREQTFYTSFGRLITLHYNIIPFVSDGRDYLLLVVDDFTERKILEQKLRASEMCFKNIVKSSPMGIFIYQLQENNQLVFIDCNDAASKILKTDCRQFVGKTLEEAFPPLIDTDIPQIYRRVCTEGISWFYENVEYQYDQIQGAYEVHVFQTQPYMAAVLFIDITGRQKLEWSLRQSEKRFRDLVQNSSDWIWEFDENEIFTYCSPRIKDLLGYDCEEIIGKSAFSIMPKWEREKAKREFGLFKEKQEPFTNLISANQHKNGKIITIESSGIPIFDSMGQYKGYRGIDRDITIRHDIEKRLRQAQKLEAIGTLAGGIAHDFNNIMTIIRGYAELAKDGLTPEMPMYELINGIIKAGERAKMLVRQIMFFSQDNKEEKRIIEITPIVKETIQFIRATTPSNIKIEKNLTQTNCKVLANPIEIHQILMNLATNSIQTMKAKGNCLKFTLDRVIPTKQQQKTSGLLSQSYVKLSVEDNGPGINRDIIDKIFDPFFTTKAPGEGTGLGLSVVHGIVTANKGIIIVSGTPGQKTKFSIFLPATDVSTEVKTKNNAVIPRGKRKKILVVDDEARITRLWCQYLEKLDYQVVAASNGQEAWEIFHSDLEFFDLVITDQTMPYLTGDQLAQKILQIKPGIPIILCTGYSAKIDRKSTEKMGIAAFMLKPVSIQELARKIYDILK